MTRERLHHCHPEEPCDEGSRVHPRYTPLCVPEILRFALNDKEEKLRVLCGELKT